MQNRVKDDGRETVKQEIWRVGRRIRTFTLPSNDPMGKDDGKVSLSNKFEEEENTRPALVTSFCLWNPE